MIPRLETERLILRPPNKKDLDNIFLLGSSPKVMQYITNGRTQSKREARADLNNRIRSSKHLFGYWIVEERHTNDFVGWLALKRLDNTSEIEIGYRFMERHWGKGYATEGSQRLLRYAFQLLNLPRVWAVAIKENSASIRVMEKIGMEFKKNGIFYGVSCVCYEITREMYFANEVSN